MKILHVLESYLPQVNGMSEVVRQLSERLVQWGHEVWVATSIDQRRVEKTIGGVKIVEFDLAGNLVRGIFGAKKEYQDFLLSSQFDVVTFFAAQQWATDLALPILDRIKAKKVFVPTGFSGFYQPEYSGYFEQMKTWIKGFDHSVFLSHDYRDINFARENGVVKLGVIPNGADEREFVPPSGSRLRQALGIPAQNRILLLVGSHTGKKGHREAIEIFRRLKSSQGITLLLVGNVSSPGTGLQKWVKLGKEIAKKLIRYQGGGECQGYCQKMERSMVKAGTHRQLLVRKLDRQMTLEAYFEADLFLFPSNIECSPIVLFEANAAGTPFFVTDVGNSVEINRWLEGGVVLPTRFSRDGLSHADIEGSAALIDEWLERPSDLKKLGVQGQKKWREQFTWEGITRQYEALYQELTKHES